MSIPIRTLKTVNRMPETDSDVYADPEVETDSDVDADSEVGDRIL